MEPVELKKLEIIFWAYLKVVYWYFYAFFGVKLDLMNKLIKFNWSRKKYASFVSF